MSVVCLWWGSVTAVCRALLFPAFIEVIKAGQDAGSKLQLSLLKIHWWDRNWPFGFDKIFSKWGRGYLALKFILSQKHDPPYQLIDQIFAGSAHHLPSFTKGRVQPEVKSYKLLKTLLGRVENSNENRAGGQHEWMSEWMKMFLNSILR